MKLNGRSAPKTMKLVRVRKLGIAKHAAAIDGNIRIASAPCAKPLSMTLSKTIIWSSEKKSANSESAQNPLLYVVSLRAQIHAAVADRFNKAKGSHAAGAPL